MIHLDAHGNIHPSSRQQLAYASRYKDVIILVHGWNNTEHTARRTYRTWFPTAPAPIVRLHWPATLIGGSTSEPTTDNPAAIVKNQLTLLANLTGYYRMRKRAAHIGKTGVAALLRTLLQHGVRCHVVGHSFGALATISALHAITTTDTFVGSATLCLAACSHYVFAKRYDGNHDGAYRNLAVTSRLRAPILVVHSKNDAMLTIPYAVASRLAGQEAVFAGRATDRYGALGVNGALNTPEARTLPYSRAARLAQPGITNVPAHELLTQHNNLTRLNLPEFLAELIQNTRRIYTEPIGV